MMNPTHPLIIQLLKQKLEDDTPKPPRHYGQVLDEIMSMCGLATSYTELAPPQQEVFRGGFSLRMEDLLDELMGSVRADERIRSEHDIAVGNRIIVDEDFLR